MNIDQNIMIETLISVFTIEQGIIKVLLIKNKVEPYKGYWMLPGNILKVNETLENNVTDVVYDKLGFTDLFIEQSHTFSDVNRNHEKRVLAVNYIGLIDSVTASVKRNVIEDVESEWFDINDVPKLIYDHENIIKASTKELKTKLINSLTLKDMYPSDFTLPEIARLYENLLGYSIDRRNLRKKFLQYDMIEETGDYSTGINGRPAKLYRFKQEIKDFNIF